MVMMMMARLMVMMMMMVRLMVVKGRRDSVVSLVMDRPHQTLWRNCKMRPTSTSPTPSTSTLPTSSATSSTTPLSNHENYQLQSIPLRWGRGEDF